MNIPSWQREHKVSPYAPARSVTLSEAKNLAFRFFVPPAAVLRMTDGSVGTGLVLH